MITRQIIERVADDRIRDAMEKGLFDNLEGAGKPLADIDDAYDPNWWIRKWMKREGLDRAHVASVANMRMSPERFEHMHALAERISSVRKKKWGKKK